MGLILAAHWGHYDEIFPHEHGGMGGGTTAWISTPAYATAWLELLFFSFSHVHMDVDVSPNRGSRFPYGCAWQDNSAQQAMYYHYVAYVKQLNEPIEHLNGVEVA
jgi:hypothetical protein